MKLHAAQYLAGASLLILVCGDACRSSGTAAGDRNVTPIYNKQTGVLEELVADRKGDGRVDMRAHMTGARVNSVEIDRNRDGRPDRWEYYEAADGVQKSGARSVLARAEEAKGPDAKVTRWEYYEHGLIRRVEEDTDFDGRVDKWEQYDHGSLVQMDLDLAGRGFPDRRLIYRADGSLDRAETDAAGDGRFKTGRRE